MLASGVRDFVRRASKGFWRATSGELSRTSSRLALDVPFRDYVRHRNAAIVPPATIGATVARCTRAVYARRRAVAPAVCGRMVVSADAPREQPGSASATK